MPLNFFVNELNEFLGLSFRRSVYVYHGLFGSPKPLA